MSGASMKNITQLLKKSEEQAQGAVFKKINLSDIVVNDQVRTVFNDIEGLAESIKESGQMQPILVYKSSDQEDKFVIIAGERRFRACKLLGLETINAIVEEKPKSDYELKIKQLAENIQRNDLSPLELAKQFQAFIDEGKFQADIALKLGLKQSFISKHLQLLKLEEPVKELMESGKVDSVYTLTNLNSAYKKDPKQITLLSRSIMNDEREPITKKESEDLVEKINAKKKIADQKMMNGKKTNGVPQVKPKEYIDVSPASLVIEVMCMIPSGENGQDVVSEGVLMTNRISLEANHVWVKTGAGKGVRTYNVPAENVKILGFKK